MPRRSLRTRLVVLSVTLVAGAIATTATIVSLSTTASIQQQYRQNIASDTAVYDALLGYAATHPSWAGLTAAGLRELSPGAGQITITDQKRTVLATTATAPLSQQAQPAATVDALSPDPTLSRSPQDGGIDARALGPFRLSGAERMFFDAAAAALVTCLTDLGYPDVTTAHYPNGRAYLLEHGQPLPAHEAEKRCTGQVPSYTPTLGLEPPPVVLPTHALGTEPNAPPAFPLGRANAAQLAARLMTPTAHEAAAARRLTDLFRSCLRAAGLGQPDRFPSVEQADFLPALVALPMSSRAGICRDTARRTQLADYVAPPALLFIAGRVASDPRPGLSGAAITRIVLAATAILLIAVVAVVVAANGVSRPLRTLTGAVAGLRGGGQHLRVPASGTKEVAALTTAYNEMSAALADVDTRRKEMISDVAHELRTPLANIRGWLEAAHDGLAEPDPAFIASLLDESVLLQSIIDDLQVLALADAGRLPVNAEPIDLGDLLEQTVSAQRPAAASKQLRVDLERRGDLRAEADPHRLRQAIGNLLANAIRYTDRGSVTVSAEGDADEILIRVADTGRGISAEDLPHIFDRFWRAEKSRDRRSGGSGLGLAITDRLIAAHGGRIDVRSTPGSGTTVTVHLPREPG